MSGRHNITDDNINAQGQAGQPVSIQREVQDGQSSSRRAQRPLIEVTISRRVRDLNQTEEFADINTQGQADRPANIQPEGQDGQSSSSQARRWPIEVTIRRRVRDLSETDESANRNTQGQADRSANIQAGGQVGRSAAIQAREELAQIAIRRAHDVSRAGSSGDAQTQGRAASLAAARLRLANLRANLRERRDALHSANTRPAEDRLRLANLRASLHERRGGIPVDSPPQVRQDEDGLREQDGDIPVDSPPQETQDEAPQACVVLNLETLEHNEVLSRLLENFISRNAPQDSAVTATDERCRVITRSVTTQLVLGTIGFIDPDVWFETENLYGEVVWTMGGERYLPPGYTPYSLRDGDTTLYHQVQSDRVFDSLEACHENHEQEYRWRAPGI